MENYSTHVEVLLLVSTTFSSRHYCKIEKSVNHDHLTEKEKLEIACWNAFIDEMLPEIFTYDAAATMFLWKIRKASLFLVMDIGELPEDVNKLYSIDPYFFLDFYSAN